MLVSHSLLTNQLTHNKYKLLYKTRKSLPKQCEGKSNARDFERRYFRNIKTKQKALIFPKVSTFLNSYLFQKPDFIDSSTFYLHHILVSNLYKNSE